MKLQLLLFTAVLSMSTSLLSNHKQCVVGNRQQQFKSIILEINKAHKDRESFITSNTNVSICEIDHEFINRPHFPDGKEPQKWVKLSNREVYVFSAFYETRELADGPAIRIIACGLQEQFNVIGDLYCNLWYEDRNYAVAVKALYQRIYPSLSHGDMWVSHFVVCPLPAVAPNTKPVPYAASVIGTPCTIPTHWLMVLNREPVLKLGMHALCTSPLYGHFSNWTMVAEMFELQTLLGAEEITIYQHSVHWHTEKLLESFLRDNNMKVNVVMWKTFPSLKSNVWCQRGALNDCLYRMGHKYEFVSITDLDEVLVPRIYPTWQQLMTKIAKPEYGAYLFQHAYFRRNYTEQAKYGIPLISQTSRWRTDVVTPPGKTRCKSMYRGSQAIKIDLHFPYLLVEGAKEYILDPEEGMLHHYRAYPMETFKKFPERFTFIEDKHMEMYHDELVKRMKLRFEDARARF